MPATTSPTPRQQSSQRWKSCNSGSRGAREQNPRAATSRRPRWSATGGLLVVRRGRQPRAIATEPIALDFRFVHGQDNGERATAEPADTALGEWHYSIHLIHAQ